MKNLIPRWLRLGVQWFRSTRRIRNEQPIPAERLRAMLQEMLSDSATRRLLLPYLANVLPIQGGTPGTQDVLAKFDSSGNPTQDSIVKEVSSKIGVGTTTPAAKLDVTNTIRALASTPAIPASGKGVEIYYDSGTDSGVLDAADRATPTFKPLQVIAVPLFLNAFYGMQFQISSVAKMQLDASGNLGIGTASPGGKLEVNEVADPNNLPDQDSWGKSYVRIAKIVNDTMNQFGLNAQVNVTQSSSSSASYEKAAIIAYGMSVDPSEYSPDKLRDIVGGDFRGIIATGNSLGRAWGLYARAETQTNANGLLSGAEIAVLNNSSTDQPDVDTTTSKYGIGIVNSGSQKSTAAIRIVADSSIPWHKGLFADQNSIGNGTSDAFIQLMDNQNPRNILFQVDRNGVISCKNMVSAVNPTNPNRTIKINIGGADYYIHAKTTND
ncbi:MAG: hypothetical protein HY647_10705 [Acidobacteria bacterium]|nr:hypothetical protein [Acidobacteriota bacterium]